jgi:NAD(P)H-nitrite reductase large subunit
LYAAGSTALIPEYEGLDTVRDKFTFMSLDDALKLDSVLGENKDKRVLIIGAGLIGLKCAEGILDKSKCVEVLARAPRILSSILDDAGAKIVQNHIESKGVKFRLGSKIERFEKNAVVLADSERLAFDILVIAAGARPNTELLSGIAEIDRGIIINEHTETTAPGIYAAGDCTQAVDVSSGENKVMAMLPNAYVQGECAGINMAGGDRTLAPAVPMNAIGLFGLHMLTAGTYSGETYSPGEDGTYKRLFYSDDRLNGYILIGDIKKAGIYTSLIRERTPLSTIDFELIRDNPGLIAFDKAHRAAKLGEVV